MFRKTLIILLGILLFFASPGFAARPLSTDDAGTVDRGAFETEVGYNYAEYQDSEIQSIGISLKHGLTEKFDFCIGVPYEVKPEEGLSGAELGVKFALLKEKENFPAVSLTFSSGFGASEYALNSILTKEIRQLVIHLNFGYVATGVVTEKGVTTYSGAIEFPLGESLVLVGEIVGEADAYSETDDPIEGLFGGNLEILEALTFDLGVDFGFNDVSPDWRMTVGLTYGF